METACCRWCVIVEVLWLKLTTPTSGLPHKTSRDVIWASNFLTGHCEHANLGSGGLLYPSWHYGAWQPLVSIVLRDATESDGRSLRAISRDPEVFPEPDEFKPQRWIDNDGNLRGDLKFFVYGFGRR
jgi:hypothetical protein